MPSPYERIYVSASIGISPADMLNPEKVVKQHLAIGLLKYHRKYEGVLLGYDKVKIQSRGQVQWDLSHIVTNYTFEGLIFRPKIGDILTGTVNNLKKNHIGLKADGIIPTSIPSHAIPAKYIFDEATSTWKSKQDDSDKIEFEDKVLFRIDIINTANGVLTLIGTHVLPESLEEEGLIPTINGNVTRAPGSRNNNNNNNNNDNDDVLDMPEGFTFNDNSDDDDDIYSNTSIIGTKRAFDDANSITDDEKKKKKKKHKKDKKKKKVKKKMKKKMKVH
jgi:DNA-directed RNA polymerase subunit E'/Rpb7